MKYLNKILLFIAIPLIMFLPANAMMSDAPFGLGAFWDGISVGIVYLLSLLFYKITFSGTRSTSKSFFIYKLIWLQDILIMAGMFGTIWGIALVCYGMEIPPPSENIDFTATIISNMAIALITLIYGFLGAFSVYLIQKYLELKNENKEELEIKKPKIGFYYSSIFYFLLVLLIIGFTYAVVQTGLGESGKGIMFEIKNISTVFSLLLLFGLMYRGNSLISLLKNLFFFEKNSIEDIKYNLYYIRNMKKIAGIFISVALFFVPIIMLAAIVTPSDINYELHDFNYVPFLGLKNGSIIFTWVIFVVFLLSIIEGKEVSKLYCITGEISTGDRFYALKYICGPAFLIFFTYSMGIILTFVIL